MPGLSSEPVFLGYTPPPFLDFCAFCLIHQTLCYFVGFQWLWRPLSGHAFKTTPSLKCLDLWLFCASLCGESKMLLHFRVPRIGSTIIPWRSRTSRNRSRWAPTWSVLSSVTSNTWKRQPSLEQRLDYLFWVHIYKLYFNLNPRK